MAHDPAALAADADPVQAGSAPQTDLGPHVGSAPGADSALAAPGAVSEAVHRIGHDVHGLVKPLLRGRIHLGALILAVPAGIVLIAAARTGTGRVADSIYALTLVGLFGASAAYHRLGRTARAQSVLRRLDHATIYLLIAGSYTPFCLLALPGAWRWAMLGTVWGAAAVGVVCKLALFDATSVLGSVLYIAMGWAVVAATPVLIDNVSWFVLGLLAAGGLLYTSGAVVLLRRWPDPAPRVFGYHEVWHTAVVVAVILHYIAIHEVVTA